MVEEYLQHATLAIGVGKSLLPGLDFMRSVRDSNVISAHFSWDGSRIAGSEAIEVKRQAEGEYPGVDEKDGIWWFHVEEVPDYTFVRIPLLESGIDELLACISGEANPDARYWRWVARPPTGVLVDGVHSPSNVKVDFIAIGYKPKALLEHFKS